MLNNTLHIILFILLAFVGNAQITVDFEANQTSACGSLPVAFTDLSSSTEGAIVSWAWELGNVTSDLENPSRIFGTPGSYTICLTVMDSAGNQGSLCMDDYIIVFANPEPAFDVTNTEGCVPLLNVEFTDLSQGVDAPIVDWIWGLNGDNGVVQDDGSLPAIIENYSTPGSFPISLTVTDANGCSNTILESNVINVNPIPEIIISSNISESCDPPLTVNFVNTSPATNVIYNWDFGNGTTFTGFTPNPVIYQEPGVYTVTCVAQDAAAGCTDTLILEDYIRLGSEVVFEIEESTICQDATQFFWDNSPEPADSVYWQFGDGGFSYANNPSRPYQQPGCYFVSLTRYINGCATTAISENCVNVLAPPAVSYTFDNTSGCTLPHPVTFEGIAPTAVSYEWDFESDGIIDATGINPSFSYTEFGDYEVTLTVTDAFGCSNTINSGLINVVELAAEVNGFTAGCVPLTINLSESNNTVAPIVSWMWEVDGMTSANATPEFILQDTGLFDVSLTIVNILGCSFTQNYSDAISVGQEPIPAFVGDPVENCVDSPVEFTDESSDFVDQWIWSFGDESEFAFEQNPEHEFADTGFYDISLTVLHNGCSNNVVYEDYIQIIDPVANFTVVYDCGNPLEVNFEDTSIGAETLFWDFGVEDETGDTSVLQNPSFIYPDTGMYTITLTASNSVTKCDHSQSYDIHITDPGASFSLSATQGCVPMSIHLLENSIDAISYQWFTDLGDDVATFSNDTLADPILTINAAGQFSGIGLVITDVNECTDTFRLQEDIFVNSITPDFTTAPAFGCAPLSVSFEDQSSNLFTNNVTWSWSINDSVVNNSPNFDYDFFDPNFYDIKLSLTDSWGCSASLPLDSLVDVTNPVAAFSADSVSCTQTVANFVNESTGRDLQYLWDFGDGNISTNETPNHQYALEGVYTVCLTVTDIYGCVDQICLFDYLVVANPIAMLTVDTTFADCPPLIVSFQNESINASMYQWDFGDGSGLSNQENPQNIYINPGVYDVTLVVSSTTNCVDTLQLEDFITLEGPLGDFTFQVDSSCTPTAVNFFAESNDEYTYIWDFGDGTPLDTNLMTMTDTLMHIYESAGTYFPKLIFVDETGCKRTVESPDGILVPSLEPDFGVLNGETSLCDTESIQFFNLSESSHPINYIEWILEGGDPSVSNEIEPIVSYQNPGTFDVTLIIDNGFCRDTLFRPNYIGVGPVPVAAFDLSDDAGCEPLSIVFSNNSTVSIGNILTYNWSFGDEASSNEINPAHSFSAGDSIEIQLQVISDVGCQDSISQFIDVYESPIVSIENVPSICIGESISLIPMVEGDLTGITYTWDASNSLSCLDCLDPLANPIDTTTYTFYATNQNGCTTSTSVTVNVRPFEIPEITLNPYPEVDICANDVIQLIASGGDDIFSYQWDVNDLGLSCYDNCFNPVAQPEDTTTYHLTVTSINDCSNTDSITVNVIDEFQSIAGPDRTICIGDSVAITAAFGEDPFWTPSEGLSCSYCPNPIAFPSVSTAYVLSVVTEMGCEIYDSVFVEVLTQEDIYAGPDSVVCLGEEIVLQGSGLGEISWTPVTALSEGNNLNAIAVPLEPTIYTLTLVNDLCTLTDDVFIDVILKTDIAIADQVICQGDSIMLQVDGAIDDFVWSPSSSLSAIDVINPLAYPMFDESFEIIGSFSTCLPDTAIANVEVNSLPAYYVTPVRNFIEGQELALEVDLLGNQNVTYEWSPAEGLNCTFCPNPTVNVDTTTQYLLTVTDVETGCTSSEWVNINLLSDCPDYLVNVPNIFSPNDDNVNDALFIEHSPSISSIETFQIFNRWGAMVYKTNDINVQWDGRDQGRLLQPGVYIYFLEFICPLDGKTIRKQGDITIVH